MQTSDSNEEADAAFVLRNENADMLLAAINRPIHRTGETKPTWVLSPKDIFMRSMSSHTFWLGVPMCLSIITYIWDWVEPRSEVEEVSLIAFSKMKCGK